MAINKKRINVFADIESSYSSARQKILQGSTDRVFVISIQDSGVSFEVLPEYTVTVMAIFPSVGGPVRYTIPSTEYAIVNGKIELNIGSSIVSVAGEIKLSVKVDDGISLYAYAIPYIVARNPAFEGLDPIGDLPTFEELEKRIAQNEGDIALLKQEFETLSGIPKDLEALRGEIKPKEYEETGASYAVNAPVYEPSRNRNYKANEIIVDPAGPFDPTKWRESSLKESDSEIQNLKLSKADQSTIDRLEGSGFKGIVSPTYNFTIDSTTNPDRVITVGPMQILQNDNIIDVPQQDITVSTVSDIPNSGDFRYIHIDENGSLSLSENQFSTGIKVGVVVNTLGSSLSVQIIAQREPLVTHGMVADWFKTREPLTSVDVTFNTGEMTLNNTAGNFVRYAIGTGENPNEVSISAGDDITFLKYDQYSTPPVGTLETAIDPDNISNGVTLTGNEYSVRAIVLMSNGQIGEILPEVKGNDYTNFGSEWITKVPQTPPLAELGAVLGYLVVKAGATDLTDDTQASYIAIGGDLGSAGSGGGGATSFDQLSDTPNSKTGLANYKLKINGSETSVVGEKDYESEIIGEAPEEYDPTESYLIGKVLSQGDILRYCTRDTTGPFDSTAWQILNLKTLFQNLNSNNMESYNKKAIKVANDNGLSNGDSLTSEQTDQIMISTGYTLTNEGGTFNLFDNTNTVGIYSSFEANDPTNSSNNYPKLVIPAKEVNGCIELVMCILDEGTTGTREVRVYNGDATSGGVEILPYIGTNNGAVEHTAAYNITSSTSDIHIYFSKQRLYDIRLVNDFINSTVIRDRLGELVGDQRLDISKIKNVKEVHNSVSRTVNPSNGWVDMIVWNAITPGQQDGISADVILYGSSQTQGYILESNIKVFGNRGTSWTGTIDIISRTSKYPVSGTEVKYRVIRDSTDVADVMRLQFFADVNFDIDWTMVNNFPVEYSGDNVTFDLANATGNLNEVELEVLDVTEWEAAGVTRGGSDGVAARNIIDFLNRCSVDFSSGAVKVYAGDDAIAEFNNSGTRLNSGEYQAFAKSSAQVFNGLTPPYSDVVMNSMNTPNFTFPEVTMKYISDTNWIPESYPRAPWTGALRPTNATNSARFTASGFIKNQKVSITLVVGKLTPTSGGTFELRNDSGTVLGSFTLNVGDAAVPSNHLWTTEITLPDDVVASDIFTFDIVRSDTASFNTNKMFLLDYGFIVETIQPDLETGVALQIDSNTRGFLPPRIAQFSSENHPNGAQAIDIFTGDPIVAKDGNWKTFKTEKISRSDISFGAYFFAEDGVSAATGGQWEGGYSGWNPAPALGFDYLLRMDSPNNHNLSTAAAHNTDALWTSAYNNGYRYDGTIYMVSGTTAVTIEPKNSGGWGAGRVGINMVVSGSNVDITPANGTGTYSVPINTMFNISIVCEDPSVSTDALVYINGEHVLTDTYGGYNGQRGAFLFQLGNSDSYLQDMSFNVLSGASEDHTFNADELNGLRYVVPHVSNPITLRIPKGKFVNGTTFTVVNGSTSVANITGTSNDSVLIGNSTSLQILPNKELTFTQTGFPKGNTWASSDSKVITPTSRGNTLFVTISATGDVLNRHGTYTGTIDVTKVSTGEYQVYPDQIAGHVFSAANTFMQSKPIDNIAVRHTTDEFAIGYPTVSTYDTDGTTVIDEAFTLILMW